MHARWLVWLALLLNMVGFGTAQSKPTAAHQEFLQRLSAAAIERTHHSVRYVSAYVHIPYPGGDVPPDTGVCTDEVIRSYRALGIDLQKEVHEDMVKNFSAYPNKRRWLLARPDPNIDHRRVPNLMVFFQTKGRNSADHHARRRLLTGRLSHMGSRAWHATHRNCRRSKIPLDWALHGRT